MPRNVKQKDFDYYLTNLDWGDGTEINREIKQFTRNDVFEHNYERPGFLNNKTKIKWNIDLQAPQSISGVEYKKMAEDLHMDGTIHSH